jgi:hypothetical protein
VPGRFYPLDVTNRDQLWDDLPAEMIDFVRTLARHNLSDLIALKASNDEIRHRAVEWLIGIFSELAGQLNRRNIPIEIERHEPHTFPAFKANMVGIKVSFRHGIRCLTVEAGWTRLPSDGFMRGGALAVAHISHFGQKRHNMDLALLKIDDRPQWHSIDSDNIARPIDMPDLARHLAMLADLHN